MVLRDAAYNMLFAHRCHEMLCIVCFWHIDITKCCVWYAFCTSVSRSAVYSMLFAPNFFTRFRRILRYSIVFFTRECRDFASWFLVLRYFTRLCRLYLHMFAQWLGCLSANHIFALSCQPARSPHARRWTGLGWLVLGKASQLGWNILMHFLIIRQLLSKHMLIGSAELCKMPQNLACWHHTV